MARSLVNCAHAWCWLVSLQTAAAFLLLGELLSGLRVVFLPVPCCAALLPYLSLHTATCLCVCVCVYVECFMYVYNCVHYHNQHRRKPEFYCVYKPWGIQSVVLPLAFVLRFVCGLCIIRQHTDSETCTSFDPPLAFQHIRQSLLAWCPRLDLNSTTQ
jgi:hypothetical protein